jgi:hypothetical protein
MKDITNANMLATNLVQAAESAITTGKEANNFKINIAKAILLIVVYANSRKLIIDVPAVSLSMVLLDIFPILYRMMTKQKQEENRKLLKKN